MNRRQALISPMVFFAAAAGAQNSGFIFSGKCKIPGDYSALSPRGNPAGNFLKGKNLIVYFTTAHRTEGCVDDLMAIEATAEALEARMGKEMIVPVAIYPQPDRADRSNLDLYIEKAGSRFVGLSGSREKVLEFSALYGVHYGRNFESHTRFAYLMNAQGQNVKILAPDVLKVLPLNQVLEFYQRPQHLPVCAP